MPKQKKVHGLSIKTGTSPNFWSNWDSAYGTGPEKINRFFTDVLGANLRNVRWSWGALDPIANRVFLRVWKHDIEKTTNGERVSIALDKPRRKSPGFAERHSHLALIQNGAEAFGVVCTAVDPNTKEARKILDFDRTTLLQLGELTKIDGQTYAHIDARVPVLKFSRQRTAQSMLTDDLRVLAKANIKATMKELLVNARVGQGMFRAQVLKLWGKRCSVTGSEIQDAIKASHIKPWRVSTNEERLDPDNGLPLVASLDSLFDAGLISFESDGKMIVSSEMNESERQIFGLSAGSLITKPTAKAAEFLAYQRENVFRDVAVSMQK